MRSGRLSVLLCLAAGCHAPAERGGWDFERMRNQPRYDEFEANRFFVDSMAMRVPPVGTVPWAAAPESLATGRVGERFLSIFPAPPDAPSSGAELYGAYCLHCHGAGGFGGTVMAANMVPTAAFNLRTATLRRRPAGYLFAVITEGVGRMPAMAWQLTPDERWATVAYTQRLIAGPGTDSAAVQDSIVASRQLAIDSTWRARQALQRHLTDSSGRPR